jgi:hypothetical protein
MNNSEKVKFRWANLHIQWTTVNFPPPGYATELNEFLPKFWNTDILRVRIDQGKQPKERIPGLHFVLMVVFYPLLFD